VIAWDHRATAFAFGCFGGLAVNVFRLYLLSQTPKTERPDFDAVYWSQLIGLTFIGGIVALAHDLANQISPLVAFNLGLSVPALAKTGAELRVAKRPRKTN